MPTSTISATASRVSPALFASYRDRSFVCPAHVRLLSREIRRAVFRPEGGRLIIDSPPRHGKSTLCSLWTPLWFLDLFPSLRVIFLSYGHDFAVEWGRKARDRVYEHPESFNFRIRDDVNAAHQWETDRGGGMTSTSVGGVLRGRGANLLVVDDPLKDVAEARSKLARDKIWNWWTGTARDRLEPGGSIIVVATRAYEDDLTGRILAQNNPRWRHIHLPAIAEDDDVLGRGRGEALWPDRYDETALAEIRKDIPSWEWTTHFQNRPAPEEGAHFKRDYFRSYQFDARGDIVLDDGARYTLDQIRVAQTIDTAFEEKEESDYFVALTYGVTPRNDLLVLHVERRRLEVAGQWRALQRERRRCEATYPNFQWQGVEDQGSGKYLLQMARRHGLALRALEPGSRDKVTRASSAIVLAENGRIFLPERAHWVSDFLAELTTFPRGAHDDQVDTLAYAAANLRPIRVLPSAPDPERDDNPTPDVSGGGLSGW